jgi:hypothetical protein
MAITLATQPITANAALEAADVKAVLAALTSVVSLPEGETTDKVVALNITVQPTGAGVLNVRFSK